MSRRAGYSLFEVLVAFAIMAAILSVLLPGQSRLLGTAAEVEKRVIAKDFALSQAERVGLDVPAFVGIQNWLYRDWKVTRTITVIPGPARLVQVQIDVEDDNGQTLAQVTTRRLAER